MTLFDMPVARGPAGAAVRVRMVVAYDGTEFRGFAVNAGVRTVGGLLTEALERVLGHVVEVTCAGRTDAGVHALGQVVTFDASADGFDPDRLQRSLNGLCGPEVVVRDVVAVADDFDARFSAQSRRYRYLVLNRDVPDPFHAHTSWWVAQPLDLSLLRLACDPFVGQHDFAAFCRRPKRTDGEPASLERRVLDLGWHDDGDGLLRLEIEATAFCHQMVRSIVATLVAAGRGALRAGQIAGLIHKGERSGVPNIAPPHGLCLLNVRYDGWSS